MNQSDELRDFLRSRRARLEPADVGLELDTIGRRSPGLRRGELALLAGISPDYYARLEQGRARNVSEVSRPAGVGPGHADQDFLWVVVLCHSRQLSVVSYQLLGWGPKSTQLLIIYYLSSGVWVVLY